MLKYKKRKDGRYLYQFQIGFKEDGHPKYKNIYAYTQPDLENKISEFRIQFNKGIIIDDKKATFGEWAKIWLETYKKNKQYNTYVMYENVVNNHFDAINNIKLRDIKKITLQNMINAEYEKGLTRTLDIMNLTLKQIFESAIDNDMIYKNPAKKLDMPSFEKSEKQPITDSEIKLIRKTDLTKKERMFCELLLATGIRKGEALALTKNDIDLVKKSVSINKTVIHTPNDAKIKPFPKSKAGIREITFDIKTANILNEYIKTVDGIYLFPNTSGKLMSKSSYRKFFDSIINKVNIAAGGNENIKAVNFTAHSFRHKYCTNLYYSGIDLKQAQYLMGHSDIKMLLDVYTHLSLISNSNQSKFSQTPENTKKQAK